MEEALAALQHEEVPFGKHKGKTLGDVYETDPGYIRFIAEKDGLNSAIFRVFLAYMGE